MASSGPAISLFPIVFLLLASTSIALSIISPSLNAVSGAGNSLGINCRGSILCPDSIGGFPPDYIGTLIDIANGSALDCPSDFSCGPLNDAEIYFPMDHILCLPTGQSILGGICAFAQGSNVPSGVTGVLIKRKLRELGDHGCRICGSVPLGGDNDPRRRGILTVNYISKLACKGLCPSRHVAALSLSAANISSLPTNSGSLLDS